MTKRTYPLPGAPYLFPDVPNPNVRHAADHFFEVALSIKALTPEYVRRPVASIVNAAFALELYLKSMNSDLTLGLQLHGISEPRKKGHDTVALLDALEAPVKRDLIGMYKAHPLARRHPDLRTLLKTYDKTFLDWRYVFEGNYDKLKPEEFKHLLKLLGFFRKATFEMQRHQLPPKQPQRR